jgi:ribosomal protein S18 acetylase RimI-like enzyme
MENSIHIRNFRMEDYDEVVALWKRAGLELGQSDDREGIARKLERDADLFLVAVGEVAIVGVVMGCYDGRRGWVNHLAVDPDYKGQGLGTQIMQKMERRLREKGCGKVNLLIEPKNAIVQTFYQRLGYQRDELIFMEKWL